MERAKWEAIFHEFEAVQEHIRALRARVQAELGEHRDHEYLADKQLDRAGEHVLDAQEHWRHIEIDGER